jgi:acetoin utilization deacetylase AcuC-like enzyme
MLPFHLVYHEGYDLHLGQHVFPAQKYRWLRERLLLEHFACAEDFVRPEPATDEDVLLVHDPGWVRRLKTGTLTYHEIVRLEIPYSKQTMEAFWLAAGGTIVACRLALKEGIGFNLGGGFHHAFPDHGEGFCALNDIAIGIRRMQRDGLVGRAMVVDCDVHQGNGTAAVFAGDDSVFTMSVHQFNNYPTEKPPSSLDIHLADGVGDEEYLHRFGDAYRAALAMFRPDLLVYVAGADPYGEDQLGGLALTLDGLRERDRLVFWTALHHNVPVAVVLAGGYSVNAIDTVVIHANTASIAREALERSGWQRSAQ